MLYAYIFLGAGILILSILFRLAAVFRLTIPLLYALVVPTLLSDWYYAHYTLAIPGKFIFRLVEEGEDRLVNGIVNRI